MKKIILFIVLCCMLTGCSGTKTTAYKADGTELPLSSRDEEYQAYSEIVLSEAASVISEFYNITEEEAEDKIQKEEFKIYTAFDENAYQSMKKTYESYKDQGISFGCAATNLKGNLVAAYSQGSEEMNYAMEKTAPYSSFKPLSVYTPALEQGVITYSTAYEDSPVKQIDGIDWPSNATGSYTNENVTVKDAVKKSVNTVAVKCLADYGVSNSMGFMKDKLGISMEYEESKLRISGEDEIIGNIALGYLQEGVSPIEMAGYYQIFANGGYYSSPKAITRIHDANDEVIYEPQGEMEQVIMGETSYVMNQLLQKVTENGGTAEKARCKEIAVGGKTGTGEKGNWFVGFTPEYSVAVWHGKEMSGNYASNIFSEIVSGFENKADVEYPKANTVKEAIYCKDSGMLLSGDCKEMELGYYLSINCPETCNEHK